MRAAMGDAETAARRWRRWRVRLAVCAVLALAGPAPSDAAPRATPRPKPEAAAKSGGSYEARLFALVNAERRRHGLRPLASTRCAARFATRWAEQLGRRDSLGHQSLRPILKQCEARRVAENVAMGDVPPEKMLRVWMRSRRHRANILDARLTHAALAARRAPSGRWYVVQNFLAY